MTYGENIKHFHDTDINFVAWPTVMLYFFGMFLNMVSVILRLHYNYSFLVTMPISILGTYSLFPVIHDGSHRSISNNKFYNELFGYTAGIPFFFAPFPTWRFVHLKHHQHTNIPDKDPDYYAGGGVKNKLILPIRWFTHIFHYYIYVIKELFNGLWRRINLKLHQDDDLNKITSFTTDTFLQDKLRILFLTVAAIIINLYLCYYSIVNSFFTDMCVLWILPSALTITLLSILFDYLPHRAYEINIRESKYKTTNMTHGIFSTDGEVNKFLALITCNQLSYHNIHHLWPKVPFYKYPEIWVYYKEMLLEKGAKVQSIF